MEATGSRTTTVFVEQPFALSESVRHRLQATSEEMAGYIGVTLRTYQRRAQRGTLADAESAKVELLDTVRGYERVRNKLLQIGYGTF